MAAARPVVAGSLRDVGRPWRGLPFSARMDGMVRFTFAQPSREDPPFAQFSGMEKTNRVSSEVDVTSILPPCACAICEAMCRPGDPALVPKRGRRAPGSRSWDLG